jgi:DNA modification methylase
MNPVQIGDATLYCGDAREWLREAPECFRVDAVLTDPPYGVGLDYGLFQDTPENVQALVQEVVPRCISMANRTILTCATRQTHFYPPPTWVLCWLNRAGSFPNPWGFTCWQPIMVYGKDPWLAAGKGSRPDVIEHSETADINGHPCPKPDRFWLKLLHRATAETDRTIFDPFMGSGTTGVACANLGRKFIGIELEPKYFDIACTRIEAAYAQLRLFA